MDRSQEWVNTDRFLELYQYSIAAGLPTVPLSTCETFVPSPPFRFSVQSYLMNSKDLLHYRCLAKFFQIGSGELFC